MPETVMMSELTWDQYDARLKDDAIVLLAVGENPRAADTAGISVNRVRYLCVLGSGLLFSGSLAGLPVFREYERG